MVSYFGLSEKIGNKSFFDSTGQSEYSFTKPYSERTAELIDEEADKIIEEQYERAKKTLLNKQDGLNQLANLLLEKEVIFTEDMERIFGKRKSNPDEMPLVKEAQNNEKEAEKPKKRRITKSKTTSAKKTNSKKNTGT